MKQKVNPIILAIIITIISEIIFIFLLINTMRYLNSNTLYYTFSMIPQVIVGAGAILGTVMFFRLNQIHDCLLGEGSAVKERATEAQRDGGVGEKGYKLDTKNRKKLRDYVFRKNIYEIKEILIILKKKEKEEGFTKKAEGPKEKRRLRGLQYLYEDRFEPTLNYYETLKSDTKKGMILLFSTIIISLISLVLADLIIKFKIITFLIIYTNFCIFIYSLIFSTYLIYRGFSEKTAYETE